MKTALLYSGHARTFAYCAPNHRWMVWRHFKDAHVFASLVDDSDADLFRTRCKSLGVPQDHIHVELVRQPEHIPLPAGCPAEGSYIEGQNFMHEPYAISVPPQAVLKQLWHLNRVWQFASESVESFDCYVRIRPDLWFHSFTRPDFCGVKTIDGKIKLEYEIQPVSAFVPWWGRFGGVNDRFAILGAKAAQAYFTTYRNIEAMIDEGCALHPESLVARGLTYGTSGIAVVHKMAVEFSTVRKDGKWRPPEISAGDIAEGLS
jgi:hypothetical protein